MAKQRVRKGGRPLNPSAKRINLQVEPTLKKRIMARAAKEGIPVHSLFSKVFRAYLRSAS